MTPRRRRAGAGPSISVILLAGQTYVSPAAALLRADVAEVIPVVGAFDAIAAEFAEAAAKAIGDLVFPLTPDCAPSEAAWAAIAEASEAHPDAGAFRLRMQGLRPDPAWRGKRARSHERNLESLRFAHLIAPGALVVRRELMDHAAAALTPELGADWWRALARGVGAVTRVVEVDATLTRKLTLPAEPACPSFAPRHAGVDVLVLGQIEVSTSLYFDFLEAAPDVTVAFRAFTSLAIDAPHLAGAGLVVLVRTLHRFWDEGVVDFLKAAGVPFVWFTDDNFLVLRAEGDASAFFTPARMRRALTGAAALWVSTPKLAEAYRPLHPDVRVWGPVLDPLLANGGPPADGPLTVVLPGGDFRAIGLEGQPIERLGALAAAEPIRVVATAAAAKAVEQELGAAEVVVMPGERSFRQFVRRWRRFGPDILLHPEGATANAPYKCPTAVIVAGYLGAAPVVADEPAYDGWGEHEGVLRLGDDAMGLIRAASGVHKPDWRADMRARLSRALRRRFDGEGRVSMLREARSAVAASETPRRGAAQVLASPEFRRRRRVLGLARSMRWLTDLGRPRERGQPRPPGR
ncbi:MAG TPA: hypothetical protein VN694_15710 [Caulobacteraceae bacterium]|nr:hypothetical protein [Caulobacteraceae bacterium]